MEGPDNSEKTIQKRWTNQSRLWLLLVLGIGAFALGIIFQPGLAGASRREGNHRRKISLPPLHIIAPKALPTKPSLLFPASLLPGRYNEGDGLCGSLLTLAADHTYKSRAYTDEELLEDQRRSDTPNGTWRLDGDRLLLSVPTGNWRNDRPNLRFIPVRWGECIYLVDENEMPGFCTDAQSQARMAVYRRNAERSAIDYLKHPLSGSEQPKITAYAPLSAKTLPVLPLRYRPYYEKGDIRARVIRLERSKGSDKKTVETRLVLNRGSLDRVTPGMRLARIWMDEEMHQANLDRGPADAIVTKVSPHQSVATVVTFLGEKLSDVRRGDTFTTGDYFNRPSGTGAPWPAWAAGEAIAPLK
jgi:hypothetical protein